jgi:hypothetical protein
LPHESVLDHPTRNRQRERKHHASGDPRPRAHDTPRPIERWSMSSSSRARRVTPRSRAARGASIRQRPLRHEHLVATALSPVKRAVRRD